MGELMNEKNYYVPSPYWLPGALPRIQNALTTKPFTAEDP